MQDQLDTQGGHVTSDYVILFFSYEDWVYAMYDHIPAAYDPSTKTASFTGPMTVTGGEGQFLGATGRLTIASRILFGPSVGTFDIKGRITTAR